MNDSCLVPSTQISITIELNVREPVFFSSVIFQSQFSRDFKISSVPKKEYVNVKHQDQEKM